MKVCHKFYELFLMMRVCNLDRAGPFIMFSVVGYSGLFWTIVQTREFSKVPNPTGRSDDRDFYRGCGTIWTGRGPFIVCSVVGVQRAFGQMFHACRCVWAVNGNVDCSNVESHANDFGNE